MPQNIYSFTHDDLLANKEGTITIGQKEWLASIARGVRKSSNTTLKTILIFILLGGGLIGFMFLQSGNLGNIIGSSTNIATIAFAVIVTLVLVLISRILSASTASHLTHSRVLKAEGLIRLDYEYFPNSALTAYYVFVGKKKFSMPGKVTHHIFEEGKKYKVYYIKAYAYELILSLEKLP